MDAGWWQNRCNFVGDAVFSDDGRYVALPVGSPYGWEARDDGYAGVVVVWDTSSMERRFIDLFAKTSKGWTPTPGDNPIPTIASFASPSSLTVDLQNGETLALVFDTGV